MIVSEQFESLGQRRQSAITRAMRTSFGPHDRPPIHRPASTPRGAPCDPAPARGASVSKLRWPALAWDDERQPVLPQARPLARGGERSPPSSCGSAAPRAARRQNPHLRGFYAGLSQSANLVLQLRELLMRRPPQGHMKATGCADLAQSTLCRGPSVDTVDEEARSRRSGTCL